MNLLEAQILTLEQLKAHGLHDVAFMWDNSALRFGAAIEHTNPLTGVVVGRTLKLSRRLTRTNSTDVVKDVILHEIAHLLAGYRAAHGPTWKAMCLKVGATPEACKKFDFTNVHPPTGGWNGHCRVCASKRWRPRRPTKNYSCGQCARAAGVVGFDARFLIVWEKGA